MRGRFQELPIIKSATLLTAYPISLTGHKSVMPIKILNLLLELKVGLNSVVVVEKEDIFMRIPLLRRPVRHGASHHIEIQNKYTAHNK